MAATLILPGTTDITEVQRMRASIKRVVLTTKRAQAMNPDVLLRLRPSATVNTCDAFLSTPLGCIVSQRIPGILNTSDFTASAAQVAEQLAQPILDTSTDTSIDLGDSLSFMWTGSLPPATGYLWVDNIPADKIRHAHTAMGKENADASAPGGIMQSLLAQTIVTVTPSTDQDVTGSLRRRQEPEKAQPEETQPQQARPSTAHNSADTHPATHASAAAQETPPAPQAIVPLAEAKQSAQKVDITGRLIAAIGALGIAAQPGSSHLRDYDFLRVSVAASWIRIDALFGTLYAPRPGGLARVPH